MDNGSFLRVGFVSLNFPVMSAKENKVFPKANNLLKKISSEIGFNLIVWPNLISEKSQAIQASEYFLSLKIDALVIQIASLIMGDVVLPLAAATDNLLIWGMDEPSYLGELSLNSLTGFNLFVSLVKNNWNEKKKMKWFWGMENQFHDRFSMTIKALSAFSQLRGKKFITIGKTVPTFDNLEPNREAFQKNFGIIFEDLAINDFFEIVEKTKNEEVSALASSLTNNATCVKVDNASLQSTAQICHALDKVKQEFGASAAALRCWPEFQTWNHIAPCAAVAWANDNCMTVSCEGDLAGAVAMYLGKIISGKATTMNDPVAFDWESGTIQMWHCGPGPASWADESGQCLDYHHTLNRRLANDEKPYGVSSDIHFAKGPATILRIRPDGSHLMVIECDIVDGPSKPFPGSGGWFANLHIGNDVVSLSDFLQMIAYYGLEHHYPIMRGHYFNILDEIAGWSRLSILNKIDSSVHQVI